jgi:hypothetical protein
MNRTRFPKAVLMAVALPLLVAGCKSSSDTASPATGSSETQPDHPTSEHPKSDHPEHPR